MTDAIHPSIVSLLLAHTTIFHSSFLSSIFLVPPGPTTTQSPARSGLALNQAQAPSSLLLSSCFAVSIQIFSSLSRHSADFKNTPTFPFTSSRVPNECPHSAYRLLSKAYRTIPATCAPLCFSGRSRSPAPPPPRCPAV
ncbi:hypothetical protein C8Q76DRAFT_49428 [Earliella scabrosa]|nr:hypothetical protein C8Q76DRAFT_49428 [Earliella scabrosa]